MTTTKSTDSLVPIDGSKRPRSYQSIESVRVGEEGRDTPNNTNDEQQCDEDARKRDCIVTMKISSYGKRWVRLGVVWVCFVGAAVRWGGSRITSSHRYHSFQFIRQMQMQMKQDSYVPHPPQYWMDLSHAYTSLYLLQSRMVGDVIFPYDKRFRDSSNIWNRNHVGVGPLAVVQAANEADVQQALPILSQLYREHNVSFRIKSGGHSYAGYSGNADGIILSVSKLNTLSLNKYHPPSTWISNSSISLSLTDTVVTMGPGTIVQQILDQALLPYGLGGVLAECSGVAEGGYVTGGGYGFLSRKYGLGVDNVRGFRVVLLDGTAITANQTVHPDLYWALRGGGGGNFGIVTSIDYQLYPSIQDTQLFVSGTIPLEVIPRFLTQLGHLESSARIPGEFSFLLKGPVTDTVSIPFTIGWIGTDGTGVNNNHTRNTTEGESYIQDSIESLVPEAHFDYNFLSWSNRTRQLGNSEGNLVRAWTGFLYNDRNTLEVWTEISNLLGAVAAKCPYLQWNVELWGGAISNVAPEDTAFYYRDALFNIGLILMVPDDDAGSTQDIFDAQVKAVDAIWPRVSKYFHGVYTNYNMESLDQMHYATAYWGNNVERLQIVKQLYDPKNIFSFPQSIPVSQKKKKTDGASSSR